MCIIDQPLTLPEVASDKTRNKTKRNGTKRNKMEKIFESVNSNVASMARDHYTTGLQADSDFRKHIRSTLQLHGLAEVK